MCAKYGFVFLVYFLFLLPDANFRQYMVLEVYTYINLDFHILRKDTIASNTDKGFIEPCCLRNSTTFPQNVGRRISQISSPTSFPILQGWRSKFEALQMQYKIYGPHFGNENSFAHYSRAFYQRKYKSFRMCSQQLLIYFYTLKSFVLWYRKYIFSAKDHIY